MTEAELVASAVFHQREGRFGRAVELLERAVLAAPRNPAILSNLGDAYRRVGRLDDALTALSRAVVLKPDLAEAIFNLGLAWRERGEFTHAVACLERAASLKPDVFLIRHELGTTLATHGSLDRAIFHFREALRLAPRSVEAHVDLATALGMVNGARESVELFAAALAIDPTFALAHNNLGVALLKLRRFDEAAASLRRAIELQPDFAEPHINLGNALKDTGLVDLAIRHYRRAAELDPSSCAAQDNIAYSLSFHPDGDDHAILKEARRWNERHAASLAPADRPHSNDRSPERRLRVGYVSADFREHVQAMFMLPLLEHHDREQVEVFCYSSVIHPDHVTLQHERRAEHFKPIAHLSDEAAARLIGDDAIDILVDLTMHMAQNRLLLFAHKPAPVQVSWLAYPGTTGVEAMDYRLTDPHLDPPGAPLDQYSEKSVHLPDSFWCFSALLDGLEPGPLPCVDAGEVTFGCLNNFCKTNPLVLSTWAKVLAKVEGSRFVLLAPLGAARDRVNGAFEEQGVDPNRIDYVDYLPRVDYLKAYQRIDIALDTFPYNGHTTSLDAWWMGVPVVTLAGKTIASRAGLCHAKNLGLPELVAVSPLEYVEVAVSLARDAQRLGSLRAGLRERIQASPLMDARRFAKNLEAAYRQMWRLWCSGETQVATESQK